MKSLWVIQYYAYEKDKVGLRVIYPQTESLGEESVSGSDSVYDLLFGYLEDSTFRKNNSLIVEATLDEAKHLEISSILHTVRTHDPLMVEPRR